MATYSSILAWRMPGKGRGSPLSTLWLLCGAHRVCGGRWGGGEVPDLCVCPGSVLEIGRTGCGSLGVPAQWAAHEEWAQSVRTCQCRCACPVWLGCGCLLLRLDLASRSSPSPSSLSAGTACSLALSATGASLACSWNLNTPCFYLLLTSES